MGFCTEAEHEEFISSVPSFENMLIDSGVTLLKYYLDIGKDEQRRRLRARTTDPLTQWKVSPIDKEAVQRWDEYSSARDEMLLRTHTPTAPWSVVRADNKYLARLNVIGDVLDRVHYKRKDERLIHPDPDIVFTFDASSPGRGRLAT